MIARRVVGVLAGAAGLVVLAGTAYIGSIVYTARSGVAHVDGTLRGLAVFAPVRIIRDERGIVHVRAQNVHDLYFAQGYALGGDRLFQIDVTRRYVLGRLCEVLGAPLLAVDERHRVLDVRAIVAREYAALPTGQRQMLRAFADGINAAARREPLPPEYRALAFAFEPWQPSDALIVGFATALDLADGWDDVIARDRVVRALGPRAIDAFFSLTDPAYDTPTVGGAHLRIAPLPALDGPHVITQRVVSTTANRHDVLGSNEWVAGGEHTTTGRALVANDPHLDSRIPGIWHLDDLAAPGVHMAGATLAGVPGIIAGHNARIAWGTTNGTVAAVRVYRETFTAVDGATYRAGAMIRTADLRIERFAVRFAAPVERRYYATRHGFVIEETGTARHAVQWFNAESPRSAVAAFYALDRAASIEQARSALATYPGPVQNIVVGDDRGRAFYTLAGFVPTNTDWGLRVLPGAQTAVSALVGVPFAQLPQRAPDRALLVNNSNNLQYGAGYPYRLSPAYSAPYRAAEIAADLRRRKRASAEDFRLIAADTTSFAERDLAHWCARALHASGDDANPAERAAYRALATFDGQMLPASRGATVVQHLREFAQADLARSLMPPDVAAAYLSTGPAFVTLMRALRERPHGWFAHDDPDAFLRSEFKAILAAFGSEKLTTPYGQAFAVRVKHPLAAFGIPWWNGPLVPGSGGRYAPAVQTPDFGQSFRSVWDVGNWDAGGIDIPLGESGEPGSPHYVDLSERYVRHGLTPLPFSVAAVARAARHTLVLEP